MLFWIQHGVVLFQAQRKFMSLGHHRVQVLLIYLVIHIVIYIFIYIYLFIYVVTFEIYLTLMLK